MKHKVFCVVFLLALTAVLSGCGQTSSVMRDGYYTAEAAVFDQHGWKEFVTLYVSDDRIVTVEYDAFNPSGFVKSWDMNYMRTMKTTCGTYPSEYARAYAVSLINWQNADNVDIVSGATESHICFKMLVKAAVNQAMAGDKHVALVEFE